MEKIKRNERLVIISNLLCRQPAKLFTLGYFSQLLGATKSSLSEDITALKEIFAAQGLGRIETVPGAAGGVRYLPISPKESILKNAQEFCRLLSDSRRALSGGYIYTTDVLSNPTALQALAEGLAFPFINRAVDFVLTIETKGIPVALMTARALGVPMVIARREHRINEGSLVTISYLSGSGRSMQTMSLPRRAVSPGQRALIVDDFMRAGGSVKGLSDLMREFGVSVEGTAVLIATRTPERKLVDKYHAFLTLNEVDEYQGHIHLQPGPWSSALSPE